MPESAAAEQSQPRLGVGDLVLVVMGLRTVRARIVEDRGEIGVDGRRIVRIELAGDDSTEGTFELPVDELTPDFDASD